MQAPHHGLAGLWRRLVWKIQGNRIVEALFWRLPYESRRWIVRVFGVNTGLTEAQVAEFRRRKTLFLHVPKTAGVSVQHALFGGVIFYHRPYRHYELLFSREDLASLYKFSFVRNPWDRLVSAWTYLRRNASTGNTENVPGAKWFTDHVAQYADFETFVLRWVSKRNVENAHNHFHPQVSFLKNVAGRIDLDFVGRYENLAEDFRQVSQALGSTATLEVRNRTRARQSTPYRECYSPKTAEVVAGAYEDDIQAFGYQF